MGLMRLMRPIGLLTMNKPIALLTDFGLRDPYVGIMKGVILGINPDATTIDLCHEIEAGDIREGSFALAMAFPYLPEGTVFCAVFDPGVGTDRRAVAVEIDGRFFVGPDNGLLSWVLRSRKVSQSVELTNKDFHLPEISGTFHGRDVFAPVAAHLSKGVSLGELGPSADGLVTFSIPEVVKGERSLQGEVVYIDHFGNAITNISLADFEEWHHGEDGSVTAHFGSIEVKGLSRTYGAVPHGHSAILFGSSGMLEIAINGGNAATQLGLSVGSHLLVYQV